MVRRSQQDAVVRLSHPMNSAEAEPPAETANAIALLSQKRKDRRRDSHRLSELALGRWRQEPNTQLV